ncbi:hypothetical protein A2U01_0077880, partial [Trifolium medium]|nr:hypothetical protein [Trifolium medium]
PALQRPPDAVVEPRSDEKQRDDAEDKNTLVAPPKQRLHWKRKVWILGG